MRCAAHCTADQYNVEELSKFLLSSNREIKFFDQVIHVERDDPVTKEKMHIFFFPYGCTIFWGFTEAEELTVLEEIKPYFMSPTTRYFSDYCVYRLSEDGSRTSIDEEQDELLLESDDMLIKLSFSHALTQSVKLEAFEDSVVKSIVKTRALTEELAARGKTSLSRKKLSQKIGALFAERNSINLHSDILDTPEFFWRRPRYEPYYAMAAEYIDLNIRINILNKRLDVIHELYEILSNELNHSHSSRLELIVIYLIAIEVVLMLFIDILKVV